MTLEQTDDERINQEYNELDMPEVPEYLTRKFIQSGATNPDYPAELAKSIIAETKKEQWDVGYMIGKAQTIIKFLENEQACLDEKKKMR